ncbi:hypothetical protein ACVWWO_006156 [Bradyrhizobium sp. F1.13.1]
MCTAIAFWVAVGLGQAGDADIGAVLDLRQRRLHHREDGDVVGHAHLHVAAFAGLDAERVAVDALDGAADPDRRRLLRQGG